MPAPSAPTTELGAPNASVGVSPGMSGLLPWGVLATDDLENVPELQWPLSVRTYHMMRNDAQVQGLYQGATLPIRNYRWKIDANGARPEAVEQLSGDLGLDVVGKDPGPRRRSKRRFSFQKHLFHALLALLYGHYYFEQVGEIGEDALWHLRKLAYRAPASISEINVAPDGGLSYIRQSAGYPQPPKLPVERLVCYVWDQEASNWVGRSILRGGYKNWLIKDRVLRVGAINIERAGGVPYVEAPPGATGPQITALDGLARKFKVGEAAGGALPHGAQLKLAMAAGGDGALEYLRFQNEEMARSFVMMFMQLGQTETGSRALGESFIDYFSLAQGAVAAWFRDIFNEHVIEDWLDWNYGEEEEFSPLLVYERDEDEQAVLGPLFTAIEKGAIVVDDEIENLVRERLRAPPRSAPRPVAPTPPQFEPDDEEEDEETEETSPAPPAQAERQRRTRAASGTEGTSPVPLPSRSLRRQPYDHEITASVDFAELDANFTNRRDALVKEVSKLQGGQIEELRGLIKDASGDLGKLASISAQPVAGEAVAKEMSAAAKDGANAAINEAKRQGKKITAPDLSDLDGLLAKRAAAVDAVLARGLSEAGARKALALTGGALDADDVASEVVKYLGGLSDAYLTEQLGGAITQGLNSGRKTVISRSQPKNIYGSELLDENTCEECIEVDGREYESVEEAESDYPTGGYMDCLGGPRCRGTLVAVYEEAEPTS